MTSNLGSDLIQEHGTLLSQTDMTSMVMEVVKQQFKPEFLNRLDENVVFHALTKDHIKTIAGYQINYLINRLESQDIAFTVDESALNALADIGFDPIYGARPLKRAIQGLENPLAQHILAGDFVAKDNISVKYINEEFIFSKD
jgi:ATP-dependent Clp protease ATP-binding subunit ClpB